MKKTVIAIVMMALVGVGAFAKGQSESTKGGTVDLLFYSPELQEQYNDMAATYKAATGVTLNITVLQTDYRTVLNSRVNSGDVPDVFMSSAYADNKTYKDYVYDLTNQDFNFDYTIAFGVIVFAFLFVNAYPEIFKVPFKFKKRKDFVTELTNAVRVKRK